MGQEKVGDRSLSLFNSPLEIGLRSLIVLSESTPTAFDVQRLVFYDYLLLHSADFEGGPSSLHPNTPHRSGELLIRREALQEGVALLQSRELIEKVFDRTGIRYRATKLARPFLDHFDSEYYKDLKRRSEWLIHNFLEWSDERLAAFMSANLDKWGAEFSREAMFYSEKEYR